MTKELLMNMYRQMTTMRRMEMTADALYKAKLIRGFCHLAIGQVRQKITRVFAPLFLRPRSQEAVSVGMEHGITPEDRVITSYRCHPFAVLRGGSIKGVLGELLGRQIGMSNGKGGSMHMFTHSFFGGNGIVGAQVPLGAGIAFAQKYREQKSCTFAMYGDGASNQGQVFEAFNMVRLRFKFSVHFINFVSIFRPSFGICHASSSAKTTNMEWEPQQNAVRKTRSTLPVVTRSRVFRSTEWISSLSSTQ